MRLDPEQRFWSKVDRKGPDDCWLWTSPLSNYGYGVLKLGGKNVKAHRLAWWFANGRPQISEGTQFLHSCHVRACCNPRHLRPGTHAENMHDKIDNGTSGVSRRRLSDKQIDEILQRRTAGESSTRIAADLGCSHSAVLVICKKKGVA